MALKFLTSDDDSNVTSGLWTSAAPSVTGRQSQHVQESDWCSSGPLSEVLGRSFCRASMRLGCCSGGEKDFGHFPLTVLLGRWRALSGMNFMLDVQYRGEESGLL